MRGLKHVLELINQDSSTNVAIVTSSVPGVYCTGADLKERKAFIAFEVREYSKALCAIFSFLKKFLEHDFLLEKLSHVASIYVINEESEPSFFIRFFKWDSGKPVMLGNSFQRKLTIVKNRGAALLDVLGIPSGFATRKWFPLTIL
ncbi:villin-3-like [Arachis ipaensis]|uniref:villin-3-like n=1 Tax=Arachis ipaensis TaxID=130454 RepID=UPI0007AFDA30|nr:villin-3-like [Arachis ipaensis]XP_020975787.1 villin-3-like [Arachis ipaensis]XP_025627531.1 villin-3 [Arachis hypogaea]XP_029146010.1 villin-3 [Arachis hypogaea]